MKIQNSPAFLFLFGNVLHQGRGDVLMTESFIHQKTVHADVSIGCENIAVARQFPAQIRSKVGQFFPEMPVVPHGEIFPVQRPVVFQLVLF